MDCINCLISMQIDGRYNVKNFLARNVMWLRTISILLSNIAAEKPVNKTKSQMEGANCKQWIHYELISLKYNTLYLALRCKMVLQGMKLEDRILNIFSANLTYIYIGSHLKYDFHIGTYRWALMSMMYHLIYSQQISK